MDQEQQCPPQSGEERSKLDELFCALYDRIRALAAQVRWRGTNPTLNPTALAHEAYMKLLKRPPDLRGKSYEEVIALFANAMRQILSDAARRKNAQKRTSAVPPARCGLAIEEALTITAALEQLATSDPRKVQIANCRFLLGMTLDETAAALGLSPRTVEREWQSARSLLSQTIQPTDG